MKHLVLFMAASLTPLYALADYACDVKVGHLLLYSNGSVNVVHTGRHEYTVICSTREEYKGVSMSTCAMWVGMLQTIKKKNGLATFYYPGEGTCATLPTYWSAPVPMYIGDVSPQAQ